MQIRHFIAASMVVGALALSGCVSWQVPASTANYGQAPIDYESSTRVYMEGYLKDPASAMYRFGKPVRAYTNHGWGQSQGGQVEWTGYLVKVEVNAKNSLGGYTGFKPYMVLFSGNAVFRVEPGNEHPLVHIIN